MVEASEAGLAAAGESPPAPKQQTAPPRSKAKPRHRKHESKSKPRRHQINTVLDRITEFNANALLKFNPEYSESEQQFLSTLDTFQAGVERLQNMQEQAVKLVNDFSQQVSSSHSSLDSEVAELQKWQAPAERIAGMQRRVQELKDVMSASRQKLARLDEEVRAFEQHEKQTTSPRFTASCLVFTLLVLVASYIVYKLY